jgi:hypothetical protein
MGAGSFVTTSSVIAPSVLFDEMEFEAVHEDVPQPPIVPAPPLSGSQRAGAEKPLPDGRGLVSN